MSRAWRFTSIDRPSPAETAAHKPRATAGRYQAIVESPRLGLVLQVKTSAAFAARFDAQANSSGLALDHARGGLTDAVRQCRHCGQQAGVYDTQCPNCALSLESDEQVRADDARRTEAREEVWDAAVRAGTVKEARFARVLEGRPISIRPWRLSADVSRWETLA
jgi:hypothetical protein